MYIFETKEFKEVFEGIEFKIVLNFEEEIGPLNEFLPDHTEEEIQELYKKLDRYDIVYFCAHMSAYFGNIHLSDDYLGGCLYDSYDQFMDRSDYFGDMIHNVCSDGLKRLKEIKTDLSALNI